MLGLGGGFRALVRLGLLPRGDICPPDKAGMTFSANAIGRHQSRWVRARYTGATSPWLSLLTPGEVCRAPVSHWEGRLLAAHSQCERVVQSSLVAFQYADAEGGASMEIEDNPDGSVCAIEGLVSADGRILGKSSHPERTGRNIAVNIPGQVWQPIFEGGVGYYKL